MGHTTFHILYLLIFPFQCLEECYKPFGNISFLVLDEIFRFIKFITFHNSIERLARQMAKGFLLSCQYCFFVSISFLSFFFFLLELQIHVMSVSILLCVYRRTYIFFAATAADAHVILQVIKFIESEKGENSKQLN